VRLPNLAGRKARPTAGLAKTMRLRRPTATPAPRLERAHHIGKAVPFLARLHARRLEPGHPRRPKPCGAPTRLATATPTTFPASPLNW
jgi:hypothetical protein